MFPILNKDVACPACGWSWPISLRKALHCMKELGWSDERINQWLKDNDLDQEEVKSDLVAPASQRGIISGGGQEEFQKELRRTIEEI